MIKTKTASKSKAKAGKAYWPKSYNNEFYNDAN